MSLLARVYAQIQARLSGTADFGTPSFAMEPATLLHEFASGIAAYQADELFADQRTLAASTSENLDLTGTLTDPLGGAVTFAKVKAILIRAAAANTNAVVVGAAASNAFVGPFGANTHTLAIPPGGSLLLAAPKDGWAVTAGTGDLLKVANGGAGTPVTYDVIIVGTSA